MASEADLVVFLLGALVGASIHLGGALWYTRRQRVRFEADVTGRLSVTYLAIVSEAKQAVDAGIARAIAAIPPSPDLKSLEDRIRAELETQRPRLLEEVRGILPGAPDLEALENRVLERTKLEVVPMITGSIGANTRELAKAVGANAASDDPEREYERAELGRAFGKKRADQMLMAERILQRVRDRRARSGGPTPPPPNVPTAPGAPPAPNSGELRPDIVAALERAGFKRTPAPAGPDGGASAPAPGAADAPRPPPSAKPSAKRTSGVRA